MPAKPVETLSLTPSSTEVITTRAKTPSISRVRVRIERSLCAQSSRTPPVTTSQTRAARTPSVRRGRVLPGFGSPRPPAVAVATKRRALLSQTPPSLIAQRLHRGLPAGLHGREEREQEAEDEGHQCRPDEAQGGERQRRADRAGDHPGKDDADHEPRGAAEQGQQQGLGHERFEDLAS